MNEVVEPQTEQTRPAAREGKWCLRLYVAGRTPKCVTALENLKRFCDEHMAEQYEIEVVDLLENPRLAKDDRIIAIPTLVRKLPQPLRKIIGDLSDTERMLVGLDLKSRAPAHKQAPDGS